LFNEATKKVFRDFVEASQERQFVFEQESKELRLKYFNMLKEVGKSKIVDVIEGKSDSGSM
jgi:hypothetical protein